MNHDNTLPEVHDLLDHYVHWGEKRDAKRIEKLLPDDPDAKAQYKRTAKHFGSTPEE